MWSRSQAASAWTAGLALPCGPGIGYGGSCFPGRRRRLPLRGGATGNRLQSPHRSRKDKHPAAETVRLQQSTFRPVDPPWQNVHWRSRSFLQGWCILTTFANRRRSKSTRCCLPKAVPSPPATPQRSSAPRRFCPPLPTSAMQPTPTPPPRMPTLCSSSPIGPEFATLDLDRLNKTLRYPIIIDGRNLYDPDIMVKYGFTYLSTGRPAAYPVRDLSTSTSDPRPGPSANSSQVSLVPSKTARRCKWQRSNGRKGSSNDVL